MIAFTIALLVNRFKSPISNSGFCPFILLNIKETIAWDITVKNNKNKKINITVVDQYPLSERKNVEVELLESSNAKIDEKTGKLTWEFEMESNEKKVFTYKYTVKYPKYVDLTIE